MLQVMVLQWSLTLAALLLLVMVLQRWSVAEHSRPCLYLLTMALLLPMVMQRS